VNQEPIFYSNKKCGKEGGDICGSIVFLLFFNGKIDLCSLCVLLLSCDFKFTLDLRCGVSVSFEH
jgi:hypothetical protein